MACSNGEGGSRQGRELRAVVDGAAPVVPNDYARPYHDRMPVVPGDDDALEWLGDEPLTGDTLQRLAAITERSVATRGIAREAPNHPPAKPVKSGDQPQPF